jgi:RNA polymerase sigma-70 factor (ECF subfamily)
MKTITQSDEPAVTSDPDVTLRVIIGRIKSGDTEAYSTVVRTFERRVTSFCTALLKDRIAVEEVTQETFIRAYRYLDSYDSDRPFYPWLARIAFRLAQTRLSHRRSGELPLTAELDKPAGTVNPLDNLIKDEQSRALWRQVLDLPAGERAAVVLFYQQELSVRQVAEALGVTAGTIKTFLFRARRHLRQRLTESRGGDRT